MIIYLFVFFSLLFLASSIFFHYKIKTMEDLRTLKLGRMGIGHLASLLFLLNSLIAIAVIYQVGIHGTVFTQIGVMTLFVEALIFAGVSMLLGFVLPLAIVVLTLKMWRRESKSIANLILPILMLLFLLIDWVYIYVRDLSDQWTWLKILSFAYPILSIYLAWQFFVFFLSSWIYGRRMRKTQADTFVVLGAGLVEGERVGVLLGNRIKAAVSAAESNEKVIIIFSGGQGADEKISEAAAMQKYGVEELNFPADRTLIESQSRTTYENLVYSSELIKEKGLSNNFIFFTSDYHVFRAALFARSLNLQVNSGRGGKTAMYYRVPAFIREFIAVLNTQKKKHIFWVGLIVACLVILALIAGLIVLF